jgi:hypothetical protein
VGGVLLGQLSEEQLLLLREVFTPWDRQGEWPVWHYVDTKLYRRGLVGAEVLRSLPVAGGERPGRLQYRLTWNSDNHWLPNDGTRMALTAAGLWHVRPESELLLDAFAEAFRYLVSRLRTMEPSPCEVVQVSVSSAEVGRHLAAAGFPVASGPGAEIIVRKVGQLLEHEPYTWSGFMRPVVDDPAWEVRLSQVLRDFGEGLTAEGYVARVEELIEPPAPPSAPPSSGPLDIPYAIDYLDAVWKAKTGCRLFVNLSPSSVARLTLACGSEEEFNSFMSAIADVLGQVVVPGQAAPPKGAALEPVRKWLTPKLDADAADRVAAAFETLIELRHVRVSQQHSDAREKAVRAFRAIGLTYPPVSWGPAWTQVVVATRGALDVIREEVSAGLPDK